MNCTPLPVRSSRIESLAEAHKAGAPVSETGPATDQVLTGLAGALHGALKAGRDESAANLYRRAQKLAADNGRLQGDAWKDLRKGMLPPLQTRLEKSYAAANADAFAQTKAVAKSLEVDPHSLDPAWSRVVIAPPQAGKVIHSAGPTVVMVQPGSGGKPGVAFMREEVSRAEYAQFANSTGRPVAHCRNRTAPITIKKRTWTSPGFPQTGAHPAVCVSFEDATAYAQWLSQRTGETYRLPTASEWRQAANYKGSGDACVDGRIDCGQDGTVAVSQGPASPLGLIGVHGNAREWSSDCAGGCKQRLVNGLGWRDGANRADPIRSSGFDAAVGFDDVGFRLVREMP